MISTPIAPTSSTTSNNKNEFQVIRRDPKTTLNRPESRLKEEDRAANILRGGSGARRAIIKIPRY